MHAFVHEHITRVCTHFAAKCRECIYCHELMNRNSVDSSTADIDAGLLRRLEQRLEDVQLRSERRAIEPGLCDDCVRRYCTLPKENNSPVEQTNSPQSLAKSAQDRGQQSKAQSKLRLVQVCEDVNTRMSAQVQQQELRKKGAANGRRAGEQSERAHLMQADNLSVEGGNGRHQRFEAANGRQAAPAATRQATVVAM